MLPAASLAAVLASVPAFAGAVPHGVLDRDGRVRHVLLISVDGMHQVDLARYVAAHPNSTLAGLAASGVQYANALTTVPSDSFPGMLAQVTGGHPGTMGVYYDDEYSHDLLPAGTTNCASALPGAAVTYAENLDKNPNSIDAGQGLTGLPNSILKMTGNPTTLIDPTQLPVNPVGCKPVYPHQYLRVNTVFEVARAHQLRTAWSDKHAAYEILNGPSGTGVQDLFTPEINSATDAVPGHPDWTADNAKTQQYDGYKVTSVLNEIDGFDHSGTTQQGVPAIFGMNFQSVSTGEKLPTSTVAPGTTTGAGGYLADGITPGPVLASSLDFVDASLGRMVAELAKQHLANSTTIIVSAKHGQSPTEPGALTRIDDGPVLDNLNAAWTAAHPGAPALVAHATDDDAFFVYLNDRSPAAANFARDWLLSHSAVGNDINGNLKSVEASGLAKIYAGEEAAKFFGTTLRDGSRPDLYGVVQHGVVYTGGKKKIAEHGGDDPQDRNVPLLISGPAVATPHVSVDHVETAQIAPTILALLGLNPIELDAVGIEHTRPLLDGLDH
jgi:hypothetical protein